MTLHIKRGFRPAAPHCDKETLCGLRIASTTWLCHYDSNIKSFYFWANSRLTQDVDEKEVCKTCARIAKGDHK